MQFGQEVLCPRSCTPSSRLEPRMYIIRPHHSFPKKEDSDYYVDAKSGRKKGFLIPGVPAMVGEEKELLVSADYF